MRDDRCSKTDYAVIADCYVHGMYFIDVDKLANPDVLSDRNSAQPLQPRSHTKSPRRNKSNLTGKPTEQNWQSQTVATSSLLPSESLKFRRVSSPIVATNGHTGQTCCFIPERLRITPELISFHPLQCVSAATHSGRCVAQDFSFSF